MNPQYERRRQEEWYMTSFFLPRERNEVVVSGIEFKSPETQYELLADLSKAIALLNHKVRYKRVWKPYEVNDFAALQNYLDECKNGGYSKALLTKKEWAILQKTKK